MFIRRYFLFLSLALILITSLIFLGFRNWGEEQFTRSFCYWKTSFNFDSTQLSRAKEMNVKHMFLRYFDVDWSESYGMAIPLGNLSDYEYQQNEFLPITPTIFITNTVFQKSNETQLNELASKISHRILKMNEVFASYSINHATEGIVKWDKDYTEPQRDSMQKLEQMAKEKALAIWNNQNNEILIDCDWCGSTKNPFFTFLKLLQKQLPTHKINCTLRLWQYKYKDLAGIPPVEKCLLMCYSTGNAKDYGQSNSIADIEEIKKYFTTVEYPLMLDLALPIYSWAVVFRSGEFKGILSHASESNFKTDTANFKFLGQNRYSFKADTVIGNFYIRYGDELRVEQLSVNDLETLASFLKKNFSLKKNSRVTFFAWDSIYLNHYGYEKLSKIYNRFN